MGGITAGPVNYGMGPQQPDPGQPSQSFNPTPTSGPGQMGPPNLSGSNFIDNGNGTYTDTSTGIMYDNNGISLGNDPSLTGAMDGSTSGGLNIPGLGNLASLAGILGPALTGLYSASKTNQATGQVTQGIQNAQASTNKLLSGPSAYAPYTAAGTQALQNLGGLGFQPINMGPLGNRPITLGNIAAPAAATPTTTTKGR